MSDTPPTILLDSFSSGSFGSSWRFSGYLETIFANSPDDVCKVIAMAEAAAAKGEYAVGFVSYEAASAINTFLPSLPPVNGLPLAWFAVFRERHEVSAGFGLPEPCREMPRLSPACSRPDHAIAISRIHDAIEKGETYQINHTFQMRGDFSGDPLALYSAILRSQRPPFGAYLDTGRHVVISASPELFFSVKNGRITARPMKGTARRGRFPADDAALANHLLRSEKERAENLMIVDLLRNDLGQVAKTGSVQTDKLFEVESYPTVHQMTSTVTAELEDSVSMLDLFRAIFPCGSVTGAPKRSSMELITRLEGRPRGLYCGAIGMIAPKGEALCSVPIRTMLFDRDERILSMGVGSGITYSSSTDSEYEECLTKASFATAPSPSAPLLESILLEDGRYPLFERHLKRLEWSATRVGYRYDRDAVVEALELAATGSGRGKVRLLLAVDGSLSVDCAMLTDEPEQLRIAISSQPVDPENLMLYLKTAERTLYEAARAEIPDADEVLFVNSKGELTEGTYNNIVLKLDGRLLTPPVESGLLPGVMRSVALDEGIVQEQQIFPSDLDRAEDIWLINSVRGWRRGKVAT